MFIFIFFFSCGENGLISRGDGDGEGAVDLSTNKDLKNKQPEAKVNKNIPAKPANPKTESKVVNTNIPVTPSRPTLEVLPVNDPTKIADVINKNPIESKVEPIDPDHRLVGADIPDIEPGEMPDYSGYATVHRIGCWGAYAGCKRNSQREYGRCIHDSGFYVSGNSSYAHFDDAIGCENDRTADLNDCGDNYDECRKCIEEGGTQKECVDKSFITQDFTDFLSFLRNLEVIIDQIRSYLDDFRLDESLPDDEDFTHNMDEWVTRTDFLEEVVNLAVERQILPAHTPNVNQMANPVR